MREACLIQDGSVVLVSVSTRPFYKMAVAMHMKALKMVAWMLELQLTCGQYGLNVAKCMSWELNHEVGLD